MIDCLILYEPTITYWTKSKILRSIFHEEIFEIHTLKNNSVCIFLWNVGKEKIWQTIFNLEITNVCTVHSYGENLEEVLVKVEVLLESRLGDSIKNE